MSIDRPWQAWLRLCCAISAMHGGGCVDATAGMLLSKWYVAAACTNKMPSVARSRRSCARQSMQHKAARPHLLALLASGLGASI